MKSLIFIFAFSPLLAAAKIPVHCSPWPPNGMLYNDLPNIVYDPPKPKNCYPAMKNENEVFDMSVVMFNGSAIVEDPVKVAAKKATKDAAAAVEVQEDADFAAMKEKLANDTATVADLRKLLKILVKKLGR